MSSKCCFGNFIGLIRSGVQGSHRLEKYLNLEDFLEKSLKINYALKVIENHTKALKNP